MIKYLGSMGESSFQHLCAVGGLVCNKSSQDTTGWDYIVEFPYDLNNAPLADKAEAPIECKIQVKATDGSSKKVQIELSNLMRLCTYPQPAFIFFIEYDGSENPQNGYLLHIDKDIIFQVLKRSRENSISKNRRKFNKSKLTLSYNEAHRLPIYSGLILESEVKKYIPQGLQEYVKEKIKHLNELGYENGYGQIKFKTNSSESLNNLIEASLGRNKEIKINDIRVFDKRFDITVPIESLSEEEAILTIGEVKPYSTGNIKFTNSRLIKTIRFPCDIYMSSVAIYAPIEHAKIRVKCPQIDILLGIHNGEANYLFNPDDEDSSLYELRDTALLMEWLWTNEDEIEITLQIDSTLRKINYTTNKKSNEALDVDYLSKIRMLKRVINDAIIIAQKMGLESQIKSNPNKLEQFKFNLSTISAIVNGDGMRPELTFMINNIKTPPKNPENVCCIMVFSTLLGDFKIYCITTFSGTVMQSESDLLLQKKSYSLIELIECNKNENLSSTIRETVNSIAASYTNEDITIIDCYNNQQA